MQVPVSSFVHKVRHLIKGSLAFKIVILFSFVLCISAFLALGNNMIALRVLRSSTDRYGAALVEDLSSAMESLVDEINRLSLTTLLKTEFIDGMAMDYDRESPEYMDYRNGLLDYMHQMLNLRVDIDNILIADVKGRVTSCGPNAYVSLENEIYSEPWFLDFMESEDMFRVLPVHMQYATPVISIVRKLRTYEKMQVNGVLKIDMRVILLDEICDSVASHGSCVYLLHEGESVYRYGVRIPEEARLEIFEKVDSGANSFAYRNNGQALYVVSHFSPYLGMNLVLVVDYNELYSDLLFFNREVVLLWILGMAVSIFFIQYALRRMSRGAGAVMSGLKQIEQGDFDTVVPVVSEDEIGRIANAVNAMSKNIKVLVAENIAMEVKNKEAKYLMLQQQIRPHFLYNTLDGIRMKALINRDEEAAEMIELLSAMLRRTSDYQNGECPLSDELLYIREYIALQNCRFRYKFNLVIDVPEDMMSYVIPKFTLQPLVENAVSHGLELRKDGREILVSGKKTAKNFDILIRDNGAGLSQTKLEEIRTNLLTAGEGEGEHIGLGNINTRLKLCFGEAYGLTIDSLEGEGTSVTLHLPLFSEE